MIEICDLCHDWGLVQCDSCEGGMMMNKLKPCPFCGGEAFVNVIEPHKHMIATWLPEYGGGAFVECAGCGCGLSAPTETEAIEKWNLRVSDLTPDEMPRAAELVKADQEGKLAQFPFVAMVEQSLQDGKMMPQKDQRLNGRYAVVYVDKKKWQSPLIDICGKPYDRGQAEARMTTFTRAKTEAALEDHKPEPPKGDAHE